MHGIAAQLSEAVGRPFHYQDRSEAEQRRRRSST
jgi:hypothetical protein